MSKISEFLKKMYRENLENLNFLKVEIFSEWIKKSEKVAKQWEKWDFGEKGEKRGSGTGSKNLLADFEDF